MHKSLSLSAPIGRPIVRDVVAAAALLTRLPLPTSGDATGSWAYGLVGAFVAGLAAIPLVAVGNASPTVAGMLALGGVALLSGALHLDGLADTADALVAPTPDAAERARLDPRIGAAGAVALLLTLGVEWAVLAEILTGRGPGVAAAVLVVSGAVSRSVAPLIAVVVARGERSGFGRWFIERTTPADAVLAPVIAVCVALTFGVLVGRPILLVVALAGAAAGGAIGAVLARLRHGLDGDAFGAAIELTFAATLLVGLVVR